MSGASGNPSLSQLWRRDPEAAARQVTTAIRMTVSLEDAAENLGIGKRTLYRWLAGKRELKVAKKTGELARRLAAP
jgi:transposase